MMLTPSLDSGFWSGGAFVGFGLPSGQRPFGGLLTELLGVFGPLSVLWRVVGGRLGGC